VIDISDPNICQKVEALLPEDVDQLPFGATRLDVAGNVVFYSRTERQQSGYGRRPTIGLDFFLEIAPCMNDPDFRGRIEDMRRAGTVDMEFGWTGDFSDPERDLTVRVVSASDGGLWIFIRRNDGDELP
jgi:photoactive yellow protein